MRKRERLQPVADPTSTYSLGGYNVNILANDIKGGLSLVYLALLVVVNVAHLSRACIRGRSLDYSKSADRIRALTRWDLDSPS